MRAMRVLLAMLAVVLGVAAASETTYGLTIIAGTLPGQAGSTLTSGSQTGSTGTEFIVTIANGDYQDHDVLIAIEGATPPTWYLSRTTGQASAGLNLAAKQTYVQRVPGGQTVTLYVTPASGGGTLYGELLR